MSKNQLMRAVTLIISAIAANGTPSGTIYALVMGELEIADYNATLDTCAQAGLLTVEKHFVRLTPKGEVVAAKIRAAVGA